MPELEKKALQLSGRKITFAIVSVAQSAVQPTVASAPAVTPAAAPKAAAEAISSEEPFVKADFSADIEPEAANGPAPEELKDILDIIGGEVIA